MCRHGEIVDRGKFIGFCNSKLTENGKKQNLQIAKTLREHEVDKIFSSDLERTFVAGSIKVQALREINFGAWEHLTWDEIQQKFPAEAQEYLQYPLAFTFPGGESFPEFEVRIFGWLNELSQRQYHRIGMITHQGVMRLLSRHYLREDFWSKTFAYGEMIKITIGPSLSET